MGSRPRLVAEGFLKAPECAEQVGDQLPPGGGGACPYGAVLLSAESR
jgi:hypothetical protein